MKNDYTHVSIVLDRSGSMARIANDTIGGFNYFIETQKTVPGECTVTLVQFDSQAIETIINAVPVREVKPLDNRTFQPRANTPLYDAIGQTINATGKFLKDKDESQRPEKVVFVIITDGLENASVQFNQRWVFDMIQHQREVYKWEFVFIGANQDALATGRSIGVPAANSYTNAHNSAGTAAMYAHLTDNTKRYRGARMGTPQYSMGFTQAQTEEQKKILAAMLDERIKIMEEQKKALQQKSDAK